VFWGASVKILVADDSKTSLAIITDSLQRFGHEVIAVSSGEAAIHMFKQSKPDLIILDVVMEGMDGFECAKKIREINDEDWIPIIFLSASVDDSSIAKGINAGGDDYIAKPFSKITLQAKIKAMQRIAEMRNKLFVTTQELMILSSTDTLTGIYNRLQFERTLKEKLSETDRHGYLLALMFIDIDNFKNINDTIGHHIGDSLLKEVAARIKSCIRTEDFFARIGGDEFVIILSNIKVPQNASEAAEKVTSSFIVPFDLEGHLMRISASVGIALYPDKDTTHASLVQNADIAMYHAKELGKNNYQFFTNELNEKYRKQVNLEQDLKFALENQNFIITYQPIYNLLDKKIVAVEALLFWKHPEYGFISPNIFVPIAEETGLIVGIGLWMLRKVCAQGALWRAEGHQHIKIFVYMSLCQFLQTNFSSSVQEIIKDTGFSADGLELELTENSIISYTQYLKESLKKLHDFGVGIAINDFGVRYSSLTALSKMPISTLKIDQAFLTDIASDSKNAIIVKSLIALGNNLNLSVMAEGIKTEEELQFLIVNGCFVGQGGYFSEPVSVDDMSSMLENNNKVIY
jgi:diguanylate cyclase (GGDEF)-like protein